MKIIHICMVDSFCEGWAYHRNIISDKNRMDGHDVTIITTRYRMGDNGENVLDQPGIFYTKLGVKVVRLKDGFPGMPQKIQDRLHWTRGLYKAIEAEKPDVIMVHNLQFFNLGVVTKYRKMHPETRLLGDTHANKYNSIGKNPKLSYAVHKAAGRRIRRHFKYFDKFAYLSLEEKEFFEKMYGIDLSNAYQVPLPAPKIEKPQKEIIKAKIREELGMDEDMLLLVHSGKLSEGKRTDWIFEALKKSSVKCRLLIIGSIPDDRKERMERYLADEKRACYMGWMDADRLRDYIAAADLYLQPGSVSVTFCNAMAVGTPVMIYPYKSYKAFSKGSEFFVRNINDIRKVLDTVSRRDGTLDRMSDIAYEVAHAYFSIENNAKFVYES
ncbi:MAG: glycosyltransferase family 4 protein [Lachnospiraceae bacterium]|nr:glycosyltransferase family 4 protein [Lachnospiraceae bacterium]